MQRDGVAEFRGGGYEERRFDARRTIQCEFTITWASVAGKKYRVQRSTTLVSLSWTDVSPEITATGNTTSFNDTGAGSAKHCYRVRLVP